jgi:hypothetical protein
MFEIHDEFLYTIVWQLLCINLFLIGLFSIIKLFHYVHDEYRLQCRQRHAAYIESLLMAADPQAKLSYPKGAWARSIFIAVLFDYVSKLKGEGYCYLMNLIVETTLLHSVSSETASFWSYRRIRACYYLGMLRHKDSTKPLCRCLFDKQPHVRQAALTALARIGEPATIDEIITLLKSRKRNLPTNRIVECLIKLIIKDPLPILSMAHLSEIPHIKIALYQALGLARCNEAYQLFVNGLGDCDSEIRTKSAKGLGLLPFYSAVPLLITALSDEEWAVRTASARSLGLLKAKEAIPHLINNLRDTHWWVRTAASEALREFGSDIVPLLETQFKIEQDRFASDRLYEIIVSLKADNSTTRGNLYGTKRNRRFV